MIERNIIRCVSPGRAIPMVSCSTVDRSDHGSWESWTHHSFQVISQSRRLPTVIASIFRSGLRSADTATQRPGMPNRYIFPVWIHLSPPGQNVSVQEVFFRTSSSDTDCVLTFGLGLFVPTLRRFCRLRSMIWYDIRIFLARIVRQRFRFK